MLELIGLASLLIQISTAEKITEFRANETYNDILCLRFTLWEQPRVVSDMKCARYCQRDDLCRASSYSGDTHLCYGYFDNSFNLSICVDAKGYRFYAKKEDFPGLGTTTEQTTATSSTSGFTDNFIVGIAIQPTAVHFETAAMTTNSASEAVTVGLSAWSFRLVNGTSSTNGRVEVYHGGDWGHVCDYYFTNVKATQICRGLGLSQIGLPVFSGYFGNHEGPYVLQQFDCTDDLKSCQEAFWMTGEACDSIAVDCSNSFDFRLVGDIDPKEGRVEVRVVGEWGTVCAMDLHGSNTQDLLCQAAGFSNSSYTGSPITVYPIGSGPIWLQSVYCEPTSETIHDCTISENPSCTHAFDASMFC